MTRVADSHVADAVYATVRPHFTDAERVDLTWAVAAINAWNWMAIAMRAIPGDYRSPTAG